MSSFKLQISCLCVNSSPRAEKDIDGDTKVEDVPDSLMDAFKHANEFSLRGHPCRGVILDMGSWLGKNIHRISERAARTDGGDPFMDFGGWCYVIAIIISSFSLALYCATVVHQGGLLKFGLAYVLAVTLLFDEYTNDILLTEEPWFPRKSDVYAFGDVLFKLLSGRRAADTHFSEELNFAN
ncbi:uncharacterized membrane protein isoform X2 [Tanacetum coccineum]